MTMARTLPRLEATRRNVVTSDPFRAYRFAPHGHAPFALRARGFGEARLRRNSDERLEVRAVRLTRRGRGWALIVPRVSEAPSCVASSSLRRAARQWVGSGPPVAG